MLCVILGIFVVIVYKGYLVCIVRLGMFILWIVFFELIDVGLFYCNIMYGFVLVLGVGYVECLFV